MKFKLNVPSPLLRIADPVLDQKHIKLYLKREDQIHPIIQGNKYRKLKYNIEYAQNNEYKGILSFGGAFSNHLFSLAAYANLNNLKSIGYVRGAYDPLNPTIKFLELHGMHLEFLNRNQYRKLRTNHSKWSERHPDYFAIPEGGTNALAIRGVEEMTSELIDQNSILPDFIFVPWGTGGTTAGILSIAPPGVTVCPVCVLKSYTPEQLQNQLLKMGVHKERAMSCSFVLNYHFGGFARFNESLLNFIRFFFEFHTIPLDPIYTGKMLFGIYDMVKNGLIPPNSKIVAIHTGGLQGWMGFNYRFPEAGGLMFNAQDECL